ncbi:hypothetical protein EJ110_NYTH21637 [Nymphaea thermarum]|nr:hypothetical protein EJ110_NYTH21637 [Nymphaea thermarum]
MKGPIERSSPVSRLGVRVLERGRVPVRHISKNLGVAALMKKSQHVDHTLANCLNQYHSFMNMENKKETNSNKKYHTIE